jgi:hypothetical protein
MYFILCCSHIQNAEYIILGQVNAILSATNYLLDVSVGHSLGAHLIYTNIYKLLYSNEVSFDTPVLSRMWNAGITCITHVILLQIVFPPIRILLKAAICIE